MKAFENCGPLAENLPVNSKDLKGIFAPKQKNQGSKTLDF